MVDEADQNTTKSGGIVGNILLAGFMVAITFGVVFLLDFLAATAKHAMNENQPDQYVHIPVHEYHHGLGRNKSTIASWGDAKYVFKTNSLGFRDASVRNVPLKSDKKRILFIGDSFTEATALPYDRTFTGLLGKELAGENVEILNAGVVSYCSIIYWRKVKHLIETVGLEFDHVVVMLDISDIHDSTTYKLDSDGNVVKRRFLKRVYEFVEQNTIVFRTIAQYLNGRYQVLKYWNQKEPDGEADKNSAGVDAAALALNHHHALWTVNQPLFEAYGRQGLANESKYLSMLAKLLKSRNIKMTLAIYPWPDQLWHNDRNSKHVVHWKTWAEQNGVSMINLFPAFFDANPKDPAKTIREHYIRGDVHWNQGGHRLVANALLAELKQ